MSQGRCSFFLATGGLACALALVPAAFFAPVYSGESGSPDGTVTTTDTLVGGNGLGIIWVVCIPAFLALTAWAGLHLRCSRGSSWAMGVAWSAVALFSAFASIGAASIGFFLIPAALLLAVAAAQTPAATTSR